MDHNDVRSINQKRLGCIVIFDGVEVLDFCGPFEVFSATGGRQGLTPFEVCTASEDGERVITRGGLSDNPAYSFENCPHPDILLMPGGMGSRRDMNNPEMLDWLRCNAESAELILSILTVSRPTSLCCPIANYLRRANSYANNVHRSRGRSQCAVLRGRRAVVSSAKVSQASSRNDYFPAREPRPPCFRRALAPRGETTAHLPERFQSPSSSPIL